MNLLVVVPARGGSKRVPHKNVAPLAGRPLLTYTLVCARDAGIADATVVSTEDPYIAEVATAAGARVIKRPSELATDSASTEAVLIDALEQQLAIDGQERDWVMTLPPTSPLRKSSTLKRFLEMRQQIGADVDCVMSVTENRGDFWHYEKDGRFRRLLPDAPRRQQDREPLFEENSAIYLTRVSALRETGSILGRSVRGIAISAIEGLDINTSDDLAVAEALISQGLV